MIKTQCSEFCSKSTSLVARRATYVVDGRFFGHFFWKVEGSSAHTRESRATHVCHVQLTCHMCHVWWQTTIWWRGALTCGSCVSGVSHVSHVAINVHITTIWWRGALTCGSRVSHVAINVHITTIWWRGPSRVAHMCHVWQLTCTLLLYGGGEPSHVAHMHSN